MGQLSAWLPIVIGGLIAAAICYKIFTDPAVNNNLGYLLLAAVFLCALPTLQNFSYEGQLGKISAVMRGDVADQSANISRDVNELGKKIDAIAAKLNASTDLGTAYTTNKGKTILIFYAAARAPLAAEVRDFLLNGGYKTSSTFTDFSELKGLAGSPGTARLTYTSATQSFAHQLRPELMQKFPQLGDIGERTTDRINSGDVQLLLF